MLTRRPGRLASAFLVYLLCASVLLGQEQSLTQVPLTTVVHTETTVAKSHSESHSSDKAAAAPPPPHGEADAPPHAEADAPSVPQPAGTIEPQYFTGQLAGGYSVTVPPGRGGMTPAVALVYHSGIGNSWLGVGWELEMGSIERQTKSGVNYSDQKYLLHSSQGSETLVDQGNNLFATEIASRFEKFEKKIAADNQPYWVVTDTQGNSREYGATAASRLADPDQPARIFAWKVSRVADILGNSISFTYTRDTVNNPKDGNLYLQSIRYTESPGLAAMNTITFESEPRPDIETSYQLGFPVKTTLRLARIIIDANGHRMPSLQINYGSGQSEATRRSLLRSIAILSADGAQQLPATQYRYQGSALAPAAPFRAAGPVPKETMEKVCVTADFNGDSLSDIACLAGPNGLWSMTLSSPTGWSTSPILGPAPGNVGSQCTVADLNGDGKSDLLCYTTVGDQWHCMFGNATTGWGDSTTRHASSPGLPISNQCVMGDMNGDGRADMACSKGGTSWEWTLSHGADWDPKITVQGPDPLGIQNVGRDCFAGDLDADGRTDISCYSGGNLWSRGISTGTTWKTTNNVPGVVPGSPIGSRCLFADFNGDRRTDTLCYAGSSNPGNQWYAAITTDAGFEANTFLGPLTTSAASSNCLAMDVNGDGRADLTCHESGTLWQTFLSAGLSAPGYKGPTFVDAGTYQGPSIVPGFAVLQQCAAGDFNGDGKGDVACHTTNDSWQMVLSDGVTPDLLSGTTTIFGGVTTFQYGHAALMLNSSVPVAIDVVTNSTTDDGTARKAATSIMYNNGYYNVPQHDFRGFRAARITGPQIGGVGTTTVLRYHQGSSVEPAADDPQDDFGYMRGRLDRIRILNESGQVLRENNFIYAASNAVPRFNPLVESVGQTCEQTVCVSTHVVRQYDRFGNVTRVEDYGDTTTAEDDVTTVITYAYNEAKYLVALPSSQEILAGVPGTERLAYSQFFYDSIDSCSSASAVKIPTRGLVTRATRWVGAGVPDVETRVAFDDYGNVVCKADPLGRQTNYTYNGTKQFLLSATNALSQKTVFTYYGVGGQPLDHGLFGFPRSVTDPNGAISTTEWDAFGRRTKTTSPSGVPTNWTYTSLGVPLKQNVRTDSGGLSTASFLDGFGRPVMTRRSGPQLKFILTSVRFNERGLAEAASLPYFEGSAPIGETKTTYDNLRRPVDEFDSAGGRRTICYSSGATDVIDENGHRTRKVISATGRLSRVERYAGVYARDCTALTPGQPYSSTQYRHDALGRLTRIIDPKGAITTISWDGLNRRTALSDPATGERHFTFDAAGNQTSWQSPSGSAVFVQYDAIGRPLQKDYFAQKALGAGDVMNFYDSGPNGIGRLTATKNASASRTIAYDLEGRPTSIDHNVGGATYHEGRFYDPIGRVSELVYPDGRHVTQTYDGPTLAMVKTPGEPAPYATFSGYNAAGFPERIDYGNNLTTELRYETPSNPDCPHATFRLCSTNTLALNGSSVLQVAYEYDKKGNVVSTRDSGVVRSYIYDDFDRLRGIASSSTNVKADPAFRNAVMAAEFPRDWAALSAASQQVHLDEGFSYDKSDDMTWKFDVGTYSYPDATPAVMNPHAPRKAGDESLTWDRDGNLIFSGSKGMAYDVEARLVAVDTLSRRHAVGPPVTSGPRSHSYIFEYDSDGTRVKESGPKGTTVYIGGLAECRAGAGCVDHIFAGSQRIATVATGGNTAYFHQDALSSTRLVTDAAARITARYSYSGYGAPTTNGAVPGFLSTNFLFGNEAYANDAGIYLFGSRPYDPHLGRFWTPDDVLPLPGSTQYLNRYSYALDNPASMIDPDGHIGFLFILIGAVIGAIAGGLIAHFTGGDWRQGAIFGAIAGAFLVSGDGFGLKALEDAAVKIATGAASGGVDALFHGGNILKGALNGGLKELGDIAINSFVLPPDLWGDNASFFSEEARKLTNATLHGAASNGWNALISGHNIVSGAERGAVDGLLGELKKEVTSAVKDEAKSWLAGFTSSSDKGKGEFVYKTPYYGNIEDPATAVINGSETFVRIKPDDSWTSVRSQLFTSNSENSFFGSTFTPSQALSTGVGGLWSSLQSAAAAGP